MMKHHAVSFRNAVSGIRWVFRTQRNFKVHLALSALSILGGWFLKISYGEFLVILVLITVGLVTEIINTAIEETIDALNKDWREEIKVAKDVSASAMLVFSAGSFLTACIIFVPKILFLVLGLKI